MSKKPVALFLVVLAVASAFADAEKTFEKRFGWNFSENQFQVLLEDVKSDQKSEREWQIKNWLEHNDKKYGAGLDEVEKFLEKYEFKWALLEDHYGGADVGSGMHYGFIGVCSDDKLIIVKKQLNGPVLSTLWTIKEYSQVPELRIVDTFVEQIKKFGNHITKSHIGSPNHWGASLIRTWSGKKTETIFLSFGSPRPHGEIEAEDVEAQELISTLYRIMYFADPNKKDDVMFQQKSK
jgi:hypothetical protein